MRERSPASMATTTATLYSVRGRSRSFTLSSMIIITVILISMNTVKGSNNKDLRATRDCLYRRTIHFGSMDSIQSNRRAYSKRRHGRIHNQVISVGTRTLKHSPANDDGVEVPSATNKMWPPWPFSMIGKKRQVREGDDLDSYPSTGGLIWAYVRQRSRIGVRQLQNLCSDLWFHLPPATPPLIILASVPGKVKGSESRVIPMFTNPFVRKIVVASLGISILSWATAELDRKRLLEPLPLSEQYQDISKAFLPPFLPDKEPEIKLPIQTVVETVETLPIASKSKTVEKDIDNTDDNANKLPRKVQRHLQQLYESTPKPNTFPSTIAQWRLKRRARKSQLRTIRRQGIYDELVALQALKRKARQKKRSTSSRKPLNGEDLGYALVTGASRGIGRALAVELARWEIPLILVARDQNRLLQLASDLEQCYGVKCLVLPADLSRQGAAEQIYKTTEAAGLIVDILVNNAGLSSSGDFVDTDEATLQNILQVNAVSVAALSRLYASDMKKRGRGRVLMVSSIVGATYAGPTVAAYAATKAFEKVLGLSMAKELEVYGVGVTNLLPGAVGDSSFRESSGSSEAVCWKIPFYVKTTQTVAEQGIRAMLEGDLEAIPGSANRCFVKVLLPILPQRVMTLITEAAWNPISYWRPQLRRSKRRDIVERRIESQPPEVKPNKPFREMYYPPRNPPKMLEMESTDREETNESQEPGRLFDSDGTDKMTLPVDIVNATKPTEDAAEESPLASQNITSSDDGNGSKCNSTIPKLPLAATDEAEKVADALVVDD